MISTALAFLALTAMVAILFVGVLRFDNLRNEVEQTIEQSYPEVFDKLTEGRTDDNGISLIPRRRFIRFLRDEEYLDLADPRSPKNAGHAIAGIAKSYGFVFWFSPAVSYCYGWIPPRISTRARRNVLQPVQGTISDPEDLNPTRLQDCRE